MKKKILGIGLAVAITASGCQAVPNSAAQDFVAAATALSQAESDYFDQLQAASNASHTLITTAIYVGRAAPFPAIATEFSKRDDFSQAKAVRMTAMSQLQNYSQQVAAIVAAATGTWIKTDTDADVTDITTLLKDQKAAKVTSQQAGLIQTAVEDLATAIINAITVRELQKLAVEAREPLNKIGVMIAEDNENIEKDNFASGLVADQQQAMLNVLHVIYDDRSVNSGQRFAAVTAWQSWKPSLITKGTDIADAMAKLSKANDALAAKQPYSVSALAQEASAAAQQALGINASTK